MAEQAVGAKELRGWTEADLRNKLGALRRELWQNRVKVASGALQQAHQLRDIRHQIARILTVLSEQQPKAEQSQARKGMQQ